MSVKESYAGKINRKLNKNCGSSPWLPDGSRRIWC